MPVNAQVASSTWSLAVLSEMLYTTTSHCRRCPSNSPRLGDCQTYTDHHLIIALRANMYTTVTRPFDTYGICMLEKA